MFDAEAITIQHCYPFSPSLSNFFEFKKDSLSAGFEPAREDPNEFLVHRLNHSATTTSGEC